MGVNPRSARQQRIAEKLRNMEPLTGTINAHWSEPEGTRGRYTVQSYDTPIARVVRHPEGHMTRHLSEQQFSPSTTQHQHIVRQHLPGEEGEPLGEQHWTRRPYGYVPGRQMAMRTVVRRAADRAIASGTLRRTEDGRLVNNTGSHYSPDAGHGMLISELFTDKRNTPSRPSRHIDRVLNLGQD